MPIKKFDFSKVSFGINWASGSVIVTLLISVITLYLTNKGLESKVKALEGSNSILVESVNSLKGSQDVTNKAIEIFMNNSPSELKYRIDIIEKTLREKFGNVAVMDTTSKPFIQKMPGQ